MKKLSLAFLAAFTLLSCDTDDGPRTSFVYAEIIEANFPEFFENGEVYEIDITYLLPSDCHSPAGLQIQRGGLEGDKRRDIYVAGVASFDPDLTNCDREVDSLEAKKSFLITIQEDEPYTFYLWTGVDDTNENIYTLIEVPVEVRAE